MVRPATLMGAGALVACACAAAGGELGAAAAFVSAHPRVARDLALFNVSKALGTLCVYRLLRESGTIVVATVTTLRKVLSVLLSVAYFGHAVGAAQWAALALVFLLIGLLPLHLVLHYACNRNT